MRIAQYGSRPLALHAHAAAILTPLLSGSCLKMMHTNRAGARVFYHCLRHAKGHASDTDLARFAVVLANAIVVGIAQYLGAVNACRQCCGVDVWMFGCSSDGDIGCLVWSRD